MHFTTKELSLDRRKQCNHTVGKGLLLLFITNEDGRKMVNNTVVNDIF